MFHCKSIFLVLFMYCCIHSMAQLKLPRFVSDSMVLQREVPLKIWGWSSKHSKVSLQFSNKTYTTTSGEEGKWTITLPAMKAGGPYDMVIRSGNAITLHDIWMGDVWLCAGQSNMVLPMDRVKETYPEEIAAADYPEIRQFLVPTATNLVQTEDNLTSGSWKTATANNILQFSATAYFFAKNIYQKYHVPVGIINASVGGTPIEAWMSEEALKAFPSLYQKLQQNKDTASLYEHNRRTAAIADSVSRQQQANDEGLRADTPWFSNDYQPKGWRNISIPGYWEDQGLKDLDGIVWYRKVLYVPASMINKPAKIMMGRIVDADNVYINGQLIGSIPYQYPPRRYNIASGVLKEGKNTITIRVANYSGKGGFVSGKPYQLIAATDTLGISGEWQYKVSEIFDPADKTDAAIAVRNMPSGLFNAMVAPFVGYGIKGILWYQGESNAGNTRDYEKRLPALISDWRNHWQQQNLPFVYVQLPNFMDRQFVPSESNWAIIRQAQLSSLSVPNTGMVVTIDLGEWHDIHPLNKKDVGYRVALAAEKVAYHENDLVYSGPVYQSCKKEDHKITISFSNTGSGLVSRDGEPLQQFSIAGKDKKFVWATAEIDKDKVVVWNAAVTDPVYVRYAWADNPDGANLYNREGLPASPFECDAASTDRK